jgi:hypothetical protein
LGKVYRVDEDASACSLQVDADCNQVFCKDACLLFKSLRASIIRIPNHFWLPAAFVFWVPLDERPKALVLRIGDARSLPVFRSRHRDLCI